MFHHIAGPGVEFHDCPQTNPGLELIGVLMVKVPQQETINVYFREAENNYDSCRSESRLVVVDSPRYVYKRTEDSRIADLSDALSQVRARNAELESQVKSLTEEVRLTKIAKQETQKQLEAAQKSVHARQQDWNHLEKIVMERTDHLEKLTHHFGERAIREVIGDQGTN